MVGSADPAAGRFECWAAGVSCDPAGDCTAVGAVGLRPQRSFAERWDGSSWSLQRISSPKGGQLVAVSCPSTRHCVAVGAFALRFRRSRWRRTGMARSGRSSARLTRARACLMRCRARHRMRAPRLAAPITPPWALKRPLPSIGTDRGGRSSGLQIRLPRRAVRFRVCRAQPLVSALRLGRQGDTSWRSIAGMATLGRSSRRREFPAASSTAIPERPAGRQGPVRRLEGSPTAEGRPRSANWLAGHATTPSSSAPIRRTASSWPYGARPGPPARRSKSRASPRVQSSSNGTG